MEQLPLTIKDPVQRYEICKECPRFFAPTRQCAECFCTMNAKVKLEDATCPLRKW